MPAAACHSLVFPCVHRVRNPRLRLCLQALESVLPPEVPQRVFPPRPSLDQPKGQQGTVTRRAGELEPCARVLHLRNSHMLRCIALGCFGQGSLHNALYPSNEVRRMGKLCHWPQQICEPNHLQAVLRTPQGSVCTRSIHNLPIAHFPHCRPHQDDFQHGLKIEHCMTESCSSSLP